MSEPAVAATAKSKLPPAMKTREPWQQQPGENALWYARFLRYVALGPTRSVSLVAKGRKNAYPVPAHWPMQASQLNWRQRAAAFDEAVAAQVKARSTVEDPIPLADEFNSTLKAFAPTAPNGEAELMAKTVKAGGYKPYLPEEDDDGGPLYPTVED